MIRLVICDGDGTLQLPSPSGDVIHLLKKMSDLNIGLAVASNEPRSIVEARFKKAGLEMPLIIAARDKIGVRKPSPKYIEYIASKSGIVPAEMLYLGDSDDTDIFCAVNAGVLPFAALYSQAGQPKYGLPVSDPAAFSRYLETYGKQNGPFFGWSIAIPGPAVEAYAVIGDHGNMGLTADLKTLLKDKKEVLIGPKHNSLGSILFHYLLSQSYLSGLIQRIDLIAVYPGHAKDSHNQVLDQYSGILPKILRNRYIPNLLIRHTTTAASHTLPAAQRDIYPQLSSIRLNDECQKTIRGKAILVLDDFTTWGNSLETARQMLLKGGATSVVGLALAKYRTTYNVATIQGDWDPFSPFTLPPSQVTTVPYGGALNSFADGYFSSVIWTAANS